MAHKSTRLSRGFDTVADGDLLNRLDVEVVETRVLVVGAGAAGLRAADHLSELGVAGVVVITDKLDAGISRNAGSDKQTYYKLTLAGDVPDSVREMAGTLFAGGAMDGDTATIEAAWSARAFYHLVDAGVGFPYNRAGEFVGYKTDHDPRQRATSAGPYTSRAMVEALQARVEVSGASMSGGYRLVDLVIADGRVAGALCWQIRQARFVLFRCDHVILATGGPASLYADAVYPHGCWGATGVALRAGVTAQNLTEWQFGLASLRPRWNVSGSYMQVVPRFVSTDASGGDEREFLADAIPDAGRLGSLVFLKGYQWPFDIRKASGSSIVDLLVYQETVAAGRRVYLDFRSNPRGYEPGRLGEEARTYLGSAGVLDLPTPVARLRGLNEPAYQLYRERNPGLDLETDRLEIGVCAQHNNGGVAVDEWWESSLRGLYVVGEAAGAHGVYRPGGAALNSGQVGAMRAATAIARECTGWVPVHGGDRATAWRTDWHTETAAFQAAAAPALDHAQDLLARSAAAFRESGEDRAGALIAEAGRRMSDRAGLVRTPEGVAETRAWAGARYAEVEEHGVAANPDSRRSLDRVFLTRDVLACQMVYTAAMADYVETGGGSRGAVLYTDEAGVLPAPEGLVAGLPESFRHRPDAGARDGVIQEVRLGAEGTVCTWRDRRPLPEPDDQFETVWREYRAGRGREARLPEPSPRRRPGSPAADVGSGPQITSRGPGLRRDDPGLGVGTGQSQVITPGDSDSRG